ncbi:MAG: orotidine-5'-phosphate decarboxylase [Alphaproteobacteria bacterium]
MSPKVSKGSKNSKDSVGARKVQAKGGAKAGGSRASERRRSGGRPRRGVKAGAAAMALEPQARIYVAIDEISISRATQLQSQLLPYVGGFKLGPAFLTGRNPDLVRELFGEVPLFLDLKLHDIPNSVDRSIRRLFRFHPQVITVHAAGGYDMLKAAAETAQDQAIVTGIPRPSIVAITVLTSLSAEDLAATGQGSEVQDQVLRLAELAWRAGLDGVVAAPRDVTALRGKFGRRLMLFTPGIRPKASSIDDHKRATTPQEALALGSDFLIIGRPLTEASDPASAARKLLKSLGQNT